MGRTATENEIRGARAKMMRYCCGEIRMTEHCPDCGSYLRGDDDDNRQRVVTVRMPKSLHDSLLKTKYETAESINTICLRAIRGVVE